MPMFFVTYEIVTAESAEHGDAESRGYVQPGGWHTDDAGDGMSLRDALRYCCPSEDCGTWFTESSPDTDYQTGAEETRSLHPPRNITQSSYKRLARILARR